LRNFAESTRIAPVSSEFQGLNWYLSGWLSSSKQRQDHSTETAAALQMFYRWCSLQAAAQIRFHFGLLMSVSAQLPPAPASVFLFSGFVPAANPGVSP
jgi:hypothetical protein